MAWEIRNEVKIEVMGEVFYRDGRPTVEDIMAIAKECGIRKFIVKVDGQEVDSPQAYDAIQGVELIQIIPYDEWGCE